ncbi:MAG: type II secretion system protein [Planctomycetota bacterium]|nr:type II secretion system protein [Planctomycetota bacterium]
MRSRQQEHGFTLVELLVVIGIITILIGMLMPVVASVQERAKQIQCLSNLRNMGMAAMIHVNDHNGYLPIAGWHFDPVGGVVNPKGLEDERERRYIYYTDNGVKRPVPFTVALAVSMGLKPRLDSRENLEQDMLREGFYKRFKCPSQDPLYRGLTQRDSEAWRAPAEWSSYVVNEALLGRRDRPAWSYPMAKLIRAKHPGQVMLAMDGRPRSIQDPEGFLLVYDMRKDDTIYDFHYTYMPRGHFYDTLDFLRHRYFINVLFADFHVERIPMTDDGLKSIWLSRGVYDEAP